MLLRDESLIATGDGSSEEGEDSIDFASPAPNNVMSMLDRIPQQEEEGEAPIPID